MEMRAVAAAGAGLVAVVALAATLLAVAPFSAAAEQGNGQQDVATAEAAAVTSPFRAPRPGEAVTDVLNRLVDERVITADQAETIIERLRDRAEELRDNAAQRRRTRRVATRLFTNTRNIIVEVTEFTREELAAAWRSGATVGAIATEAGLTRDELADALSVAAGRRIDRLLEAERISDERAAALRDRAAEWAPAIVDRVWDRSHSDARGPGAGTPGTGSDG